MSDINLDFTVSNNSINFTVEPNEITITPTDIQLSISTSTRSNTLPGGSNTQLQYNQNGILGGIPNVTWNGTKLSLGNVANVRMTGGVNGYVLQTDGTGNLTWTAQTGGGGGNGVPGGSNTQIQYNDSGSFGGNVGFTFNELDGNVDMPANLIVANTVFAGELRTNDNKIILGNGASSNTSNTGQGVTIGYFAGLTNQGDDAIAIGDAAGQTNQGNSSIAIGAGAGYNGQGNNSIILNASGTQANGGLANAFYVNPVRANVTGNALYYNNITNEISYGILDVSTANYANFAGTAFSVAGSNVTGTVANATFATTAGSATTAGTVTTNAQPNITSVGTLANLSLSSNNIQLGNRARSNNSFGISIGYQAGNGSSGGANAINIGTNAGYFQSTWAIAIGLNAGNSGGATASISIGRNSGLAQKDVAIAIGDEAGGNNQGAQTVALGQYAGRINQGNSSIAIGQSAGSNGQANLQSGTAPSIAIGAQAAAESQGNVAIAIGSGAGYQNQGQGSIAIGHKAGNASQHANTIILNADAPGLNSTQANSLFIKPIRDVTGNAAFSVQLYYNPTTGEVGYK
jgi:hypothetical protein